jgi:hypothetical protein
MYLIYLRVSVAVFYCYALQHVCTMLLHVHMYYEGRVCSCSLPMVCGKLKTLLYCMLYMYVIQQEVELFKI